MTVRQGIQIFDKAQIKFLKQPGTIRYSLLRWGRYFANTYAVTELHLPLNAGKCSKRIGSCCESSEDLAKSKEVKLVLYSDEAHLLATRKVTKDPDGKDMYDVLCFCFDSFLSFPVFVNFLSTSSSLSQITP
jgi:hypothetical protein